MIRLTIGNQRGGVGKTTTAVTIARLWAERGLRTLLVDADPQGSIGSILRVKPELYLNDFLWNKRRLADCVIQPVKNLETGKVEITAQNHGFAVDANTLPSDVAVNRINLNDQTVEGMRHKTKPIFCVQYHPEASPGPHDSTPLFDEFRALIERH